MIVLGVDPGTLITGYGIIENRNGKLKVLLSGAVRNRSIVPMPERLKNIYLNLSSVIEKYRPDQFAIETAFYGKNAQSALKLGHARGVAMLTAVTCDIPTHEYSPREVKKAVVGNGSASKEQVQYMIKTLLHIKETPKYYDITDALAVALCYIQQHNTLPSGRRKSWASFVAEHPERCRNSQKRKLS
jgi:crossover junction endodeoxyribonuclease RuvC